MTGISILITMHIIYHHHHHHHRHHHHHHGHPHHQRHHNHHHMIINTITTGIITMHALCIYQYVYI